MTENNKKSTEAQKTDHRSTPKASAFTEFIAKDWAKAEDGGYTREPVADYAAERRAKISKAFPGERLVLPAGPLKVRSNDCDYRFRPHSAFAHQTGLGVDHEPDAVLVFEPVEEGTGDNGSNHEVTLYFRPLAGRDTTEFYADARYGEFWVGPRPTLKEFSERFGIRTRDLSELEVAITKNAGNQGLGGVNIRLVFSVARTDGNDLGYDTIAACGNNATILHWIRNNGTVDEGKLLLLDAGVEDDTLYTADVTRTFPVNGKFTEVQAKVYNAVLDAADAAFAVAKPGTKFYEIHEAAMNVLAHRLEEWGLLPVSADVSLTVEGGQHRRWMPHGTSHHLAGPVLQGRGPVGSRGVPRHRYPPGGRRALHRGRQREPLRCTASHRRGD